MIRGAMVSHIPNIPDISDLVTNLGATHMRYQLTFLDPAELASEDVWKQAVIQRLDLLDTIVSAVPIKAVLDIHSPPGGMDNGVAAMFTSAAPWGKDAFVRMWRYLAERYKGNNKVPIFDLWNEPHGTSDDINALFLRAYTEIKKIDSNKYISISSRYGSPAAFDKILKVPSKRIYYQAHMYAPQPFTCQGLETYWPVGKVYPANGWNKDRLKKTLTNVRKFQLKHNALIYIGEFAACTNVDPVSRFNYYRDLLDIFKEYKWNWTYHAWREAPVWNIESDPNIFSLVKDHMKQ